MNCNKLLGLIITVFVAVTLTSHIEAGPVGNIRGVPKLEMETRAVSSAILVGAGNVYLMLGAIEDQKPAEEFQKNAKTSFDKAVQRCRAVLQIIQADMRSNNITGVKFSSGLAEIHRETVLKKMARSDVEARILKDFQKTETPLEGYRPICEKSKNLVAQIGDFRVKDPRLPAQWRILTTLEEILIRGKVMSMVFESAKKGK